ncbi:GntR family transcriptional regulator [Ensifer soli]|uniref:GntR family transcriptional regulator n=1 Tax=Ciceribacter sp. sgz301302 TaxID=3342379 RepID=UPI0035B7B7E0
MGTLGKIDRGNLSSQVYDAIRNSLMDGRYPPGDRLRISALADELGVSITPVREAIFRLVSEHALEMTAATAIRVRDLKAAEVAEIQTIRHHLEGEAALQAAARITPPDLQALETLQEDFRLAAASDPQQAALLNRQFHFQLVAAARMPLIFATVENMWTLLGPLLRLFHMTVPARDLASERHKHYDVLAALRARDGDGARAAIQADIGWGRLMVEWMEERSARG